MRVAPDYKPRRMNHTVVVLVGTLHRGALEALAYAKSLAPNHLVAVTIVADEEEQERIEKAWAERRLDIPLEIVHSPYRELDAAGDALHRRARRPLRERHHHGRASPSSSSTSWWAHLLHNQSALLLKGRLLFRKGTVVTSVPYHIIDADADGRNPAGDAERRAPRT